MTTCFCVCQLAQYTYHDKGLFRVPAQIARRHQLPLWSKISYLPSRNWTARFTLLPYWDRVFLQEAFLFLGLEIKANNWRFDNTMLRLGSMMNRIMLMTGNFQRWRL